MIERERTRQQLDPAGTMGMRVLCGVLAGASFVYAVAMTLVGASQRSNVALAVLALVVLAVACLAVIFGSSPYRAPLNRRIHLLVHVAGFAAVVIGAAAQWGSNSLIADDWGPICLGTLLLTLAPYRPALELAFGGILSAIFLGFLTLLEAPQFVTPAPPVAFVIVSVTPMLALCFGGVWFSSSIVNSLERWRRRAREASRDLLDEVRDGIARSVQQDRVTILNRDVVPFFSELVAKNRIDDADRERARAISESIRSVMVAEIDRSWLESVVDAAGVGARVGAGASAAVLTDTDHVAGMMTTRQRTAMRALLVALIDTENVTRNDLRIVLTRRGEICRGVLTARLELPDSAVRTALSPYFAVMRSVFADLQVDFVQPTLTLKFSYEQR